MVLYELEPFNSLHGGTWFKKLQHTDSTHPKQESINKIPIIHYSSIIKCHYLVSSSSSSIIIKYHQHHHHHHHHHHHQQQQQQPTNSTHLPLSLRRRECWRHRPSEGYFQSKTIFWKDETYYWLLVLWTDLVILVSDLGEHQTKDIKTIRTCSQLDQQFHLTKIPWPTAV